REVVSDVDSAFFLRGRRWLPGDGLEGGQDAVAQVGEVARSRGEVLVARRSILVDLRLQRRPESLGSGLALVDRLERRLQQGRVAEELDLESDDLGTHRSARCLETLELGGCFLHRRLEQLPLGGRMRALRAVDAVEVWQ